MNTVDHRAAKKYVALLDSSQKRGIEFDLPLMSLLNLYKAKRCYYTGVSLTLQPNKPNSLTLDRVDNNKGYVSGNVVACSNTFNNMKGCLSVDDIVVLYSKVMKHVENDK